MKSARNVKNLVITPSVNSISVKIPLSPNSYKQKGVIRARSPVSPNSISVHSPLVRARSPLSPNSPSVSKSFGSNVSANSTVTVVDNDGTELLEFFDRILCPRNIVLLNTSRCASGEVWEAMATVLVYLLKFDYLSEDSLTEQCLAVYRQDWPQVSVANASYHYIYYTECESKWPLLAAAVVSLRSGEKEAVVVHI